MVVNPASPQFSQSLPAPRPAETEQQVATSHAMAAAEGAPQQQPTATRIIEPTTSSNSQQLDSGDTSASGLHQPPWDMVAPREFEQSSTPPGWRQPEAFHQSEDLAELLAEAG